MFVKNPNLGAYPNLGDFTVAINIMTSNLKMKCDDESSLS